MFMQWHCHKQHLVGIELSREQQHPKVCERMMGVGEETFAKLESKSVASHGWNSGFVRTESKMVQDMLDSCK